MSASPKPIRMWNIAIGKYPASIYTATTRSKAVYDAFLNFTDAYPCSFHEFLGLIKVTVRREPPARDGYDYVRRAYAVDPTIGQRCRLKNEGPSFNGREGTIVYPGASTAYVEIVLDGEDRISRVHPRSVELLPMVASS